MYAYTQKVDKLNIAAEIAKSLGINVDKYTYMLQYCHLALKDTETYTWVKLYIKTLTLKNYPTYLKNYLKNLSKELKFCSLPNLNNARLQLHNLKICLKNYI